MPSEAIVIAMRALVVGGTGFLGSHLVKTLLREGYVVYSLARGGSNQKLKASSDEAAIIHIQQDAAAPLALEVDEIYNLASSATPAFHKRLPFETIHANVMGTWNLLNLAARTGARFFQSSTIDVYRSAALGPVDGTLKTSSVNTMGSSASYTESKRLAETLCFEFLRHENVDVRVGRLFSTYGPGMAIGDGRVISTFAANALTGKPLVISSSPALPRSFLYLSDAIQGIVSFIKTPGVFDTPLNFGHPRQISLEMLAQKIVDLTNSNSEIQVLTASEETVQTGLPDLEPTKDHIGWEASVNLEEGLQATIAWFEDTLRDVSASSD